MSYLHCHACGWDNGDFGETGIKLQMLKWDLIELKSPGYAAHVKHQRLTALKFILIDIKGIFCSFFQLYKSYDEYIRDNPDGICPNCGSRRLDID